MIIIDGRTTGRELASFHNLEELLVKVIEEDMMDNRIVTDVLVDNESFSEIYPHQAEDIETGDLSSVEIRSVPVRELALDITTELDKVIRLMNQGGRNVADLFRQANDAEALEIYQDLLDVTRDFLNIISLLRQEFRMSAKPDFIEAVEEITDLFSEMTEVMENEDWILLADLLEYEFIPATNKWKSVIASIRTEIGG